MAARFDQINVIPFIDIMLVLLAMVLTTATFIAQGKIPVTLPSAEHADAVSDRETLTFVIDVKGQVYIDDEIIHKAALDQRLSTLKPTTEIILKVDAESNFEHFVTLADRFKAYDLERVSILTRQTK